MVIATKKRNLTFCQYKICDVFVIFLLSGTAKSLKISISVASN